VVVVVVLLVVVVVVLLLLLLLLRVSGRESVEGERGEKDEMEVERSFRTREPAIKPASKTSNPKSIRHFATPCSLLEMDRCVCHTKHMASGKRICINRQIQTYMWQITIRLVPKQK
jgi:hypothetical protein